ncbi:hypothetical protein BDQ17DRAFT_1424969 [Cyathus striatus]|nr:hypothetical protein BDQ17DRAFT_1424969 [Cyathus striatus]
MANFVTNDADTFLAKQYDVIIVGGGTAGLVVAARLSEVEGLSVGVLEAGPDRTQEPILKSGSAWMATAHDPQFHWGFSSVKQENLLQEGIDGTGRVLNLPRGKLLGGSGIINALIWLRASKGEYDALESTFGNKGWNFETLLPYFKKSQTHTAGPIQTSQNWWYSSLASPVVDAMRSASFEINDNPDGGNSTGIVNCPRNLHPESCERQSSVAYLDAAEGRSNISILVGAYTEQVLFSDASNGLIATGVKFQVDGKQYVVKANKEVILAAGAYQTPQLLELSGIGLKSVLDKHDIETKIELPVGENMQDHLMIYLNYQLKDEKEIKEAHPEGYKVQYLGADRKEPVPHRSATASVTGGPLLTTTMASMSVDDKGQETMDKLVSLISGLATDTNISPITRAQYELQKHWLTNPQENIGDSIIILASIPGYSGVPGPDGSLGLWLPMTHLHPTSRGSVHISSSNPLAPPKIDLQCLNEYDLLSLVRMAKFGDSLVKKGSLASFVVQQPQRTDAEFEEMIKKTAAVQFHPLGTTPMASHELGGVVDTSLKVYGTKNLRIIDASIIPMQIGAMTQATLFAIAEKAADIIKAELVG